MHTVCSSNACDHSRRKENLALIAAEKLLFHRNSTIMQRSIKLQTLKGLYDPRNKADNPNPRPLPDIFGRLPPQGDREDKSPPFSSSADEPCVRETLESNYSLCFCSSQSWQNLCEIRILEIVKGNLITFIIFWGHFNNI